MNPHSHTLLTIKYHKFSNFLQIFLFSINKYLRLIKQTIAVSRNIFLNFTELISIQIVAKLSDSVVGLIVFMLLRNERER